MHAEFFHACLVAEDAAFGAFAAWVDGEDGESSAVFLEDVNAEFVYAGALAGSWDAADADSDAFSCVWQTLFDDFLRYGLMLGYGAFDECHGLPQYGDVTFQDAFHVVVCGEMPTCESLSVEVWIDG